MINNLLRGFIYFVVFVLIQVLVLNNIHFLRIATPFLYLYFIIKMPVGSSRTQVVFFSFIAGVVIDTFSNTHRVCMRPPVHWRDFAGSR